MFPSLGPVGNIFLYEDEEMKRRLKLPTEVKWEVCGKGKCTWCFSDCCSSQWDTLKCVQVHVRGRNTESFSQTLVPAVI